MFFRWLIQRYWENELRYRVRMARMRAAYEASERLRAELSHLEHEIYELRDSQLPRRQKALLEQAIRVRCRHVETEMVRLQMEIAHSGHAVPK